MKPQELFLLYEKQVAEFKLNLIRKLSGETPLKRASNLSMIEAVLKAAGKPLHVTDLIGAVEKQFGVILDRDSLSSALGKQVHKERRFVRVAPNTFGLRQT